MKEISLEEMQSIELNILVDFTNYCDKQGLVYFLCGGTLIGAIRHKGFIPWDDDVDIMMPREDYLKALKGYTHPYYKQDSVSIDSNSTIRYARINDIRTVLKTNQKEKYPESIFIDVFPMDGFPEETWRQKLFLGIQQLLIACHLATLLDYKVSNRYADRKAGFADWRKYLRTLVKYIMIATLGQTSPSFWARLIDQRASRESYAGHQYVGVAVSGPHGLKEIMPSSLFQESITVDFEKAKLSAPRGYDEYLTKLYGDYRKMPPQEQRKSHHDFQAWWK